MSNINFRTEDRRTKLALQKRLGEFKKTYTKTTLTNDNTGKFWDNKFKSPEKFEDQDPMTKEKIDFIISLLPKKKSKILDLGIGQGYLEQGLKQLRVRHEMYGVDISRKSIERAKKKFEGRFIVSNVLEIEKIFKKNFFDAAVAIELIEHIPPSKIFSLYTQIYNSLKKNGTLIISTPLNERLRHMDVNPSAHLREYTVPIIEAEFKISGFKIVEIKTFYAFKKWYGVKKLLSNILKTRWKPNSVVTRALKE